MNVKDFLIALIGSATGFTAYGLVFVILLLAGFGLPLPEDIPLIMGGVLVHRGQADLWVMIVTGYLGIIIGDSIMFGLGRRFGSNIGAVPGLLRRVVTPERRAWVEGLFKKHGEKLVLAARFLPGVRTVTYFTAGSVGMHYPKFALYDSIAALASAPLFVLLGYKFGADIESLLARIAAGERNVIVAILAVFAVVMLIGRWRARSNKANAEAALEQKLHPHSGAGVEVRADRVEER